MLKIAEARSSEFHSAWGVAGSQDHKADYTDGELRIRELSYDFDKLLRWEDEDKAKKASSLAIGLVKNWHIGYSQNNGAAPRTTMTDELEKHGGDPAKIDKDCNTDCSAMIAAIVRSCGINISKDMYTGNEIPLLVNTGAFSLSQIGKNEVYQVGDILWRDGHTAIVVDVEPERPTKTVVNCKSVNFRNYVGTPDATPIHVLYPGDKVELTGNSVTWYEGYSKGKLGWISGKYLD